MNLVLAIQVYFSQSETFKDISRYLFWWQQQVEKGKKQAVFPSIERIAIACQCSTRTVKRYIKAVDGFPIKITKRTGETNLYEMDKGFFKALLWLDLKNLLHATCDRFCEILKQATYEDEKYAMSPPSSSRECHPSLTLSQTLNQYSREYVHPKLLGIGIAHHTKIRLSKLPEHAIIKGIEDAAWWWRQGNRPRTTLDAVVTSRIQNYARKHS